MTLKINLPLLRTLFQASQPFLLYSLICCIETTLLHISPLLFGKAFEAPFIQSIKDILIGFYSNYALFMVIMLILNLARGPTLSIQSLKTKNMVLKLIKDWLCFTLIFACFQFAALSLTPWTQIELSKENGDFSARIEGFHRDNLPRILEEDEGDQISWLPKENEVNIESLGVGKVIGSLKTDGAAVEISKNGKTAFVIEMNPTLLNILDISDHQSPKLLSTVPLLSMIPETRSPRILETISLLLSSDENLLYTNMGFILEIVDISNLKSPKLLSSCWDKSFRNNPRSLKTSISLSWDQKTVYLGGRGLQIFSVEDPEQPSLVFSSCQPEESPNDIATSVATSADGKTLYFANGTIQVFNISDNSSKPALESTFNSENNLNSIILGKDNRTLYVAGLTPNKTTVIEKIDLGALKSLDTFSLGIISASAPYLLEKSPSESTFFLTPADGGHLRAYRILSKTLLHSPKNLFPNFGTLKFIPGTSSAVIINRYDGKLNIVKFFSNYPNRHSYSLSNSTIQPYCLNYSYTWDAVPGFSRLYTILRERDAYSLNIFEVSNQNSLQTIGSYPLNIKPAILQVCEIGKRLFVNGSRTQVFDISDPSSMKMIGSLEPNDGWMFIALGDGKTVLTYSENYQDKTIRFKMMNYSDLSSIEMISQVEVQNYTEIRTSEVRVSKQGIIFLCSKTGFTIYNLSAPEYERRISLTSFVTTEDRTNFRTRYFSRCTLVEERNVLFVELMDQNYFSYLRIYDVSDMKIPKLLKILSLPRANFMEISSLVTFASDGSKAYFSEPNKLLVIDLSDLENPKIIGQIPKFVNSEVPHQLYIFRDDKTGIITQDFSLFLINLKPSFSLYLENQELRLGEKHAVDLMFLQLNSEEDFERSADSDYKILKLSLSQISVGAGSYESQQTLTLLPEWMTFDKEHSLLHIESKKEKDLDNYTLHAAVSLKIPFEAFNFIGNESVVKDLVGSLISFGFLDNQRFLTPSFGNENDFLVASPYYKDKGTIYRTLKQYYVETLTPFAIVPSLELKENSDSSLAISTPSTGIIKVKIKLSENQSNENSPQFLKRTYGSLSPVITEYKTQLMIEGSLSEVNKALAKLVVNNKTLACDGEIIVTDQLNHPLEKNIKNIAQYFTSNKPPRVNLDVQSQINMVPLYTGEFAMVTLNQKTFIDENVEDLNYKVVMNTPERHEKPSWLVFSNNDLVMKITAPEQLFSREIKLLLIAENEFEKVEIPFTLKIQLSPVYLLKVLMKLSPYILTIIGLYIKANKIYNILFWKWYKHPKEFFVKVGRDIEIPPVWFIAEERKESEMIFKGICKKTARDLGCSLSNRAALVDYFWDLKSGELDTVKLRQSIEEVVNEIEEENKKPKLYLSEGKSRRPLISQMIENTFVIWRLNLKQEKPTKDIYNKMKNEWPKILKWDKDHSQFVIKQEKFNEILESLGGKMVSKVSAEKNIDLTQISTEDPNELLLSKDLQINVNLLKKALIALALEKNSLNKDSFAAYVKVKQRKKSNCLKRLLRKDLKEVGSTENRNVVYKIMYEIEGGRLEFTGKPHQDLEGETLVIQITNSHGRILKEFWINGITCGKDGEASMMIQSDHEAL